MVWSRETRLRRTLVRMDSAVAVQTKALGSLLWTFMYSSIEAIRSGTEWNTPLRSALPVSSRNHRSTRFSQDEAFGSLLWTFMYSSIEAIRSGTEWNTPLRSALPVSSRNHRSTRFSQDEDVGVKCSWNRGCLASQATTFLCLWVA